MNRRFAAIAVGLPIAIMAVWLGLLVQGRMSGVEVELPIQGYDPRDLLSGHYLTYRLDFGGRRPCETASAAGEERCVCVTVALQGASLLGEAMACERRDATACPVFLKGTCERDQFVAGIERFYIPETLSGSLATIPSGATIVVKIRPNGAAQVLDLKVNGKSVKDSK